jgi:hypothetical protein
MVNAGIAGVRGMASLFSGSTSKDKTTASYLKDPLNQFALNTQEDQGDYDINSGMFRVNQDVYAQDKGMGPFNFAARGGNVGQEIEMTEDELRQFLAAGGQVEYL